VFKLVREIKEEFAYAWIITIAIHHLVFEVVLIVTQFVLYVTQLRVEFILLTPLGGMQVLIECHGFRSYLPKNEDSSSYDQRDNTIESISYSSQNDPQRIVKIPP